MRIKLKLWDKKLKYFWHSLPDGYSITLDGKVLVDGKISNEMEIVQFTGIQDKNGKDIYEGDIVLHDALPGAKNGLPIVYENCKFIIKGVCESDNIILSPNGRSITVIGNIYSNL